MKATILSLSLLFVLGVSSFSTAAGGESYRMKKPSGSSQHPAPRLYIQCVQQPAKPAPTQNPVPWQNPSQCPVPSPRPNYSTPPKAKPKYRTNPGTQYPGIQIQNFSFSQK